MKLISWNVTRQCHLHCPHCYRDAGEAEPEELSTQEGKNLIKEIAQAGFQMLILSGGEPLSRPDITELIAHASKTGLRPVLGTTGTLIDKILAENLKTLGLQGVGISLDSVQPKFHDSFRGVKGSWEAAVEGIKNCISVGLPVQINTTASKKNYQEIEDITALAEKWGVRGHHIFFLIPTGRGQTITEEMLTPQEYETLLRRILDKQKSTPLELKPTCAPQFMRLARQMKIPVRFSKGCLAGLTYGCILPQGEVHPCPYLPLPAGNVRTTPFHQIWSQSFLLQELRKGTLKGKCGKCEYSQICGGCRARAYYQEGDLLAEDRWCLYEPVNYRQ